MNKQTLTNIWITVNIVLAVCMVYCVISLGLTHKTTWTFIILTNVSALLFLLVKRGALKNKS